MGDAVRVVALGGGTGLPGVLEALRGGTWQRDALRFDISAIVTVTDDGGSSGRLRRGMGSMPPGDIRNCLVALSDAPEVLRSLFQFRFREGELEGHALGNLFIAALAEVTGDFAEAVHHMHDILAIRGRIFPSTLDTVQLLAERQDGSTVLGEAALPVPGLPIRRVTLQPASCRALPDACRVLQEADVLLLGPGSLFTSIIPNLLVPEIADAIRASKARRVYILNLTTQPGETDGFAASHHVRAIHDHAGFPACETVLHNTTPLPEDLERTYRRMGQTVVAVDTEALQALGCRRAGADLLADGPFIRHDPAKLRRSLVRLAGAAPEGP